MPRRAAREVTETAQKVKESETVQKGLEVAKQKAQVARRRVLGLLPGPL